MNRLTAEDEVALDTFERALLECTRRYANQCSCLVIKGNSMECWHITMDEGASKPLAYYTIVGVSDFHMWGDAMRAGLRKLINSNLLEDRFLIRFLGGTEGSPLIYAVVCQKDGQSEMEES